MSGTGILYDYIHVADIKVADAHIFTYISSYVEESELENR
jgi:UDP-glucose 4-epimerase